MTSTQLHSAIGRAIPVTSTYKADVMTVFCDWLQVYWAKDRTNADWTTMTSLPTGSQNGRRPTLPVCARSSLVPLN